MTYLMADLHMHGAIGFQEKWLKLQGYYGKNLAKLIADKCFNVGIDVCALTSEEHQIPFRSVHDRLNYLKENYFSLLPRAYETSTLGENIFIIKKNEKILYLINSQTVIINEKGKRYDYLVVGSNQVPNGKNFKDTHNFCNDHGLIRIAEHPILEAHYGMGSQRLLDQIEDFHAIEGHNAQMIFPKVLKWVPKIGKYNRELNKIAKEFALRQNKPYIATSDAHSISGIGIANIGFEEEKLNTSSQDNFIKSLTDIIKKGSFTTKEEYQDLFSWFSWTLKFQRGKIFSKEKFE